MARLSARNATPGARHIDRERFGGYVCPSCLMLDKQVRRFMPTMWSLASRGEGSSEDRLALRELLKRPWAATGRHTCYYVMNREVQEHSHHAREFAARRIGWTDDRGRVGEVVRLLEEASAAIDCRDDNGAASICLRTLALNPHHPRALYLPALAKWCAGDLSEAISHISHAMEGDERDQDILALWTQIGALRQTFDVR